MGGLPGDLANRDDALLRYGQFYPDRVLLLYYCLFRREQAFAMEEMIEEEPGVAEVVLDLDSRVFLADLLQIPEC